MRNKNSLCIAFYIRGKVHSCDVLIEMDIARIKAREMMEGDDDEVASRRCMLDGECCIVNIALPG